MFIVLKLKKCGIPSVFRLADSIEMHSHKHIPHAWPRTLIHAALHFLHLYIFLSDSVVPIFFRMAIIVCFVFSFVLH